MFQYYIDQGDPDVDATVEPRDLELGYVVSLDATLPRLR